MSSKPNVGIAHVSVEAHSGRERPNMTSLNKNVLRATFVYMEEYWTVFFWVYLMETMNAEPAMDCPSILHPMHYQ